MLFYAIPNVRSYFRWIVQKLAFIWQADAADWYVSALNLWIKFSYLLFQSGDFYN